MYRASQQESLRRRSLGRDAGEAIRKHRVTGVASRSRDPDQLNGRDRQAFRSLTPPQAHGRSTGVDSLLPARVDEENSQHGSRRERNVSIDDQIDFWHGQRGLTAGASTHPPPSCRRRQNGASGQRRFESVVAAPYLLVVGEFRRESIRKALQRRVIAVEICQDGVCRLPCHVQHPLRSHVTTTDRTRSPHPPRRSTLDRSCDRVAVSAPNGR